VPKQKKRTNNSDVFLVNGNEWKSALVSIEVSGEGNYILAKLKLLHPNSPKTKIAKEILEKALLDVNKTITSF
jgi:hypothetical protein